MRTLAIALALAAPAAGALEPPGEPVTLTVTTDLPGRIFHVRFTGEGLGNWPCENLAIHGTCELRVLQSTGTLIALSDRGERAVSREFFAAPGNDRWQIGYGEKRYYGYAIAGISLGGAGALLYGGIKSDSPLAKLGCYSGMTALAVLAEIFLLSTLVNNFDAERLSIRPPGGFGFY